MKNQDAQRPFSRTFKYIKYKLKCPALPVEFLKIELYKKFFLIYVTPGVLKGSLQKCQPILEFPFAKLLRDFCGTKRKIFLSLRISFARNNNNLRNHSQKSFSAKLPYSAFAKLKFCAIPQFRKNQMVDDGVCFLEFNSGKILFWNRKLITFT